MSTTPPPVRPLSLRTMRRSAPTHSLLLPALLCGLAGCITISDDEYAWRLAEGGGADTDDGGDDGGGACEGGGEELVFYTDSDGDGFGDPRGAVWDCEQPDGTVTNSDDCDDSDPSAALLVEWWLDGDGDGIGGDVSLVDCQVPSGYTSTTGDCDDARDDVFPGATEVCDGIDNNCDELADDDDPGVDLSEVPPYFRDADADGYGDADDALIACEIPDGYVLQDGDCDDGELYANPGLDEICNDGIDNDCDEGPGDCVLPAEVDLGSVDVTFTTTLSYVSHGAQVLSTGDMSGDGVGDMALSAPGESAVGAVYLVDQFSALSGDIDTSSVAMARLEPTDSGGRLGYSLAALGDLDGDGLDDLLIGDPYDTTAGSLAGAAWLVTGPLSGDTTIDEVGVALWGEAANAFAGWSVALAGDVDSDGEIDLLVGAYRDGTIAPQAGSAYLVRGPVTADRSLADADWVVRGDWQDRVGYSLAGGADLNGDGVPDVGVGSDRSDPGGLNNAGTVGIFYGPVSGIAVLDDADALRTGASDSAFLGYSLASGGDLDADGYDDLVMGAPGEGSGVLGGPGAVFVELGPLTGNSDVSGADAWVSGAGASDSVGTAVRILEDIDGNGDDELFIGAPGTIGTSGLDDGAALLWTTSLSGGLDTTSADVSLYGDSDGRAGTSVDGGQDLDGDGQADLLIGAPSANQAHVVFGRGL